MPRSMWKGAISFGLVTIPVSVYPATEEKTLRFNQLHDEDGGRIRMKRTCSVDGEEVTYDHIVKGYEYEKDKYVVLTDDDFDAVPVASSRAIDIVQFVDLEDIDPIMYKKTYYLIPEETGAKAYALLREAMSQVNKVGIAKVSFRDKEHLSALRFKDDAFVLETMYWPDEIREADFGGVDVDATVRDQELDMAKTLIENLTADWNPDEFTDEYREALLKIVEAKIAGEEIEFVEAEPTAKVVDLMAALKASVDAAKKRPADDEEPAPKTSRAEVVGEEACGQVSRQEGGRSQGSSAEEGIGGVNLPPGFTSRPATLEDLDDVATLVREWDLKYVGESEAARAMLQYEWGAASFDMERDTRVIHAADGALAAFAQHSTPDPGLLRYDAFGPVDPAFEGRGLGSAIIDWTEAETRSRIGEGSTARLWNSVQVDNDGAIALFETYGYTPIRSFWQMTMDLDRSFDAGSAPEGVTIRPVVMEVDGPAAQSVLNTAFRSHFGHVEETFEEWLAQQEADDTWDPTLGLLAEVDGTIVGYSNNGVIDGVGYVFELGVLPEMQGRGIGRALLRHSFAMLAARGIPKGRLGVDTQNVTGAVELYRSVGLIPVSEHRVVEKLIAAD